MRKLAPFALAVGLLTVACGPPDVVVRSGGDGVRWFPGVLDAQGDVGAGLALATDADGSPHLSYLAFEEEPDPGQPPPVPDPDAPLVPAVLHAHIVQDVRTRSVVAEELAVTPEDHTAIAVDADGVHHVVWTEDGSLWYSNTAGGDFSEPEDVLARAPLEGVGAATSPSIAVDGATPWVAYSVDTEGEGPGGLVRVATLEGDAWTAETVAEAGAATQTAIGVADEEVLVAYGSQGATMLARGPGTWDSETADEDGGSGVSMAVDGDGNPHLAYQSEAGAVKHAHSVGGGPWEVTDIAEGGDPAAGGTTIALDQEGIHHVAWASADGIGYATNEEGSFAAETVPGSENGALPRLGIGPDGEALLAWYDTDDTEVQLAVRAEDPPLLALPGAPEEPTAGPTGPPDTGPPPCQPDGTDLAIAAPPGAAATGFDTDCLAAPAGDPVTIDFDNQDEGIQHNVAIYVSDGGDDIFVGEIISGPDQITYDVDPIDQTGNLFFRCDVHPTTMTGTFVVAEA